MQQEETSRDPKDDQFPPKKGPTFCSLRYGLCLLLHLCNVVTVSQNVCLSLTMLAMVNRTEPRGLPNASAEDLLDSVKNPQYNWSLKTQGVILSSIMYGLLIAQIPAGYLSGIFSIRKMIGCSLLLSSLLTLLTPLAATAGEAFLMACRALQGLGQGTTLTAQHVIWVKWAPPLEQGRLTSMSISGSVLGPFIALLLTGFICQSLGWPMVFYIFGACGCALSLVWFALYHDNPEAHPCISVAERDFITASLAGQVSSSGHTLPIRAMLRSLPVWVISLTSFAYFWMMRIIIFYSPMFISSSLHTEVQENGMLSALPYLFAWILSFLSGPMADCFLARNILSMLTVRKLFTTLGLLLPAVFSVCLASAGSSIQSVVVFLVLTNATTSFCTVGMLINPLDIAPRYYGFLKGMTILIGMTGGLISTTVTGIILDQDPESSWFKIFFLMAAINVTSLILYLIFAKAEIQDWAKERQHTRL
ncbi:sodium-dependent phosphate transport protein 1-like isoform X4 [Pteropus medius]|uniref:sodium-dependent phosphate transport protein 1-like isoform X4 n=1 Tax=Pteropus vampyrus TaxID=132908 RepID=UPI00196B238A|nr:sodium-dependent phosphate transport protein 1-like isoform X4 [Pteropus giganteus]